MSNNALICRILTSLSQVVNGSSLTAAEWQGYSRSTSTYLSLYTLFGSFEQLDAAHAGARLQFQLSVSFGVGTGQRLEGHLFCILNGCPLSKTLVSVEF